MHRPTNLVRVFSVVFALVGCAVPSAAQLPLRLQVAAGYAAGVDSPALHNGSWSVRASLWRIRARGAELGLTAGRDQFEDRTLRTGNLFFNPATGSTGTNPCGGCVAGSASVRTVMSDWYVAPAIAIRQRHGVLQPYASFAIGAYRVRDVRDTRFLPASGAPTVGASTITSRRWTAGAHASVGAQVAVSSRVALDVSSQLHGAALIGNDYAGGTAYAVLALGVAVRR